MRVEEITLPEIQITLKNDEAQWLMEFIQNYPGDPNDEEPKFSNLRLELFNALHCRLT